MTEFFHVYPKEPVMKPGVGRMVHYVPFGTPVRPDGTQAFASNVCRAATITEVGEAGSSAERFKAVGLCVMNPTGLFFHSLASGGVHYDESHAPGTWHWPERV